MPIICTNYLSSHEPESLVTFQCWAPGHGLVPENIILHYAWTNGLRLLKDEEVLVKCYIYRMFVGQPGQTRFTHNK